MENIQGVSVKVWKREVQPLLSFYILKSLWEWEIKVEKKYISLRPPVSLFWRTTLESAVINLPSEHVTAKDILWMFSGPTSQHYFCSLTEELVNSTRVHSNTFHDEKQFIYIYIYLYLYKCIYIYIIMSLHIEDSGLWML